MALDDETAEELAEELGVVPGDARADAYEDVEAGLPGRLREAG